MAQDTIYIYNPITFEYVGTSKAKLDVLGTKALGKKRYTKPAHSTFIKPPKAKKNEIVIFEKVGWAIKKDFRGSVYYEKNGKKHIIEKINETIPEWAVLLEPPKNFKEPVYDTNDNKWVDRSIVKELKYNNISVRTKEDVNKVTSDLIKNLGEEKIKTLKLLAGNGECKEWDDFIITREKLLEEGKLFIKNNYLEKSEIKEK